MNSLSRNDLSLLLSLGAMPLVACQLDVGDGLTAGGTSITSVGSGAGSDDGGTGGDDGDGPGTATNATNATSATNGGNDGGVGDTGMDGGADSGQGPMTTLEPGTGSADGGQVDDSGGGYGDSGYGGSGDAGGYGQDPVCDQVGTHVSECGLGDYGADYCNGDIYIGMFLGAGCQSAMQDYYSCLSTTDCAALGGDPCGRDQVGGQCGGVTPQI